VINCGSLVLLPVRESDMAVGALFPWLRSVDLLGSTAFSPVKSDFEGNITVCYSCFPSTGYLSLKRTSV